ILASQSKIVGAVSLTPIQHWFFDLELPNPAHFNQEELLETDGLEPTCLEQALLALIDHHDVLRLRVTRDGDHYAQRFDDEPGAGILACHDLSALDESAIWPKMAEIADEVQSGLDLESGPVIRAALIDLGHKHGQRLLLVIHHLAVDGVSWR